MDPYDIDLRDVELQDLASPPVVNKARHRSDKEEMDDSEDDLKEQEQDELKESQLSPTKSRAGRAERKPSEPNKGKSRTRADKEHKKNEMKTSNKRKRAKRWSRKMMRIQGPQGIEHSGRQKQTGEWLHVIRSKGTSNRRMGDPQQNRKKPRWRKVLGYQRGGTVQIKNAIKQRNQGPVKLTSSHAFEMWIKELIETLCNHSAQLGPGRQKYNITEGSIRLLQTWLEHKLTRILWESYDRVFLSTSTEKERGYKKTQKARGYRQCLRPTDLLIPKKFLIVAENEKSDLLTGGRDLNIQAFYKDLRKFYGYPEGQKKVAKNKNRSHRDRNQNKNKNRSHRDTNHNKNKNRSPRDRNHNKNKNRSPRDRNHNN